MKVTFNSEEEGEGGVVTVKRTQVKRPRLYKVLLHNDDYTTMEFVIHVLESYFNKNRSEAEQIMLHVHHEGVGVCGLYTYEIAETKVMRVTREAKEKGHPLLCTAEPE
jgi:ATP-dependent Clp protease adaptor protein ClpS